MTLEVNLVILLLLFLYGLVGLVTILVVTIVGAYLDLDQARAAGTFSLKLWLDVAREDLADYFIFIYVLAWPMLWTIISLAGISMLLGEILSRLEKMKVTA